MNRTPLKKLISAVIACAGMLAVGSAQADPPSWSNGQGDKHHEKDSRHDSSGEYREHEDYRDRNPESERYQSNANVRFADRDRDELHAYYRERFRSGHCPPGLAKKHNGCMPPGQAKRWSIGRPLPRDVVFYDLPPAVTVKMVPPPVGYRYVRVASDILLIAAGTGMVMDAIEDLGRQ